MISPREGSLSRSSSALGVGGRLIDALLKPSPHKSKSELFSSDEKKRHKQNFEQSIKRAIRGVNNRHRVRIRAAADEISSLTCFDPALDALALLQLPLLLRFLGVVFLLGLVVGECVLSPHGLMAHVGTWEPEPPTRRLRVAGPYPAKEEWTWAPNTGSAH